MTQILKVITEYCSLYVDDVRLSDLAATNMPLYARRMYQYFKPAISLFTIPDYFVIGYGLDCGEYYRNLPYVAEYDPSK